MSNVADIKPWFREDISRTLMSIYFASIQTFPPVSTFEQEEAYRKGFAAALSSVALAAGVNPQSFLMPEDVQRLKAQGR